MRVFYCPEQIYGINDLLNCIEMSFSLDHVAQAPSAERLQVVMHVRQFSQKYGDMLRLDEHGCPFFIEDLGLAQNLFLEPSG